MPGWRDLNDSRIGPAVYRPPVGPQRSQDRLTLICESSWAASNERNSGNSRRTACSGSSAAPAGTPAPSVTTAGLYRGTPWRTHRHPQRRRDWLPQKDGPIHLRLRQCSRTVGRIENCRGGGVLAYCSGHEAAFVDRTLCISKSWADDGPRRGDTCVPQMLSWRACPASLGVRRCASKAGVPLQYMASMSSFVAWPSKSGLF